MERFGSLVNNITSKGHLTFSNDEIPAEGKGHNQPLHISVRCGGYMIARVLIDNGSSLNVLPKATLDKLTSTDAQLGASSVVVQAFDGSKKEVMGEITLPILIGPAMFNITFQIISIMGEKELVITTPTPDEYIEGDEEALEASFQSLEVVGAARFESRNTMPTSAEDIAL
ncbi:hypothetical protein CR513_01718, partial [Mucuna pruriens]